MNTQRWVTHGKPCCGWCGSENVAPVAGMQGKIEGSESLGVWACFDCGGPNEVSQEPDGWLLRRPGRAVKPLKGDTPPVA
jgi:hypothetical protein